MAKKKSYDSAYLELQEIVQDIQSESTSIDQLAAKIKKAKALIEYCKTKLRSTEEEVEKLFVDEAD